MWVYIYEYIQSIVKVIYFNKFIQGILLYIMDVFEYI
jgi:hypothetical protein